MNYEERKALSLAHRDNPEPGDYWHECFSPICVVLAVSSIHGVLVCKTIKWPDPDHWTWDLSKTVSMFGDSFANFQSYSHDRNHKLGTHSMVEPRAHEWAIECWKETPTVVHETEAY